MKKRTLLHRVLMRRGISTAALAAATGVSVATLHNLSSGNSRSRRLRERASLFIGETIWADVPVKKFTVPAGSELDYESEEDALRCAAEFGDSVKVNGKSVTFIKAASRVWIAPRSLEKRRLTSAREAQLVTSP